MSISLHPYTHKHSHTDKASWSVNKLPWGSLMQPSNTFRTYKKPFSNASDNASHTAQRETLFDSRNAISTKDLQTTENASHTAQRETSFDSTITTNDLQTSEVSSSEEIDALHIELEQKCIFDLIIASECVYAEQAFQPLCCTLKQYAEADTLVLLAFRYAWVCMSVCMYVCMYMCIWSCGGRYAGVAFV